MSKNENLFDLNKIKRDLKNSKGDKGHALIKAGLVGMPFPGTSIVAELFNFIIEPPISKRRDQWMIKLAESLIELEERIESFWIEDLSKNDSFLTTLMHASQIVIRNHQIEKLEALKNAVINSALPNAPEDDMKIIFLNFIDSFTVTHINLLKFFHEKKSVEWIENLSDNIPHNDQFAQYAFRDDVSVKVITFEFGKVMEYAFDDYIENNILYQFALKDLDSQGMIIESQQYSVIPLDGHNNPQVQPFGRKFINFIKEPKID